MAPHSSTLAWKIPWTEKPGGLQFMGSLRVGHDWATSLSLFTFLPWRRKWQPTPVFLPGESQGRGSLVAAVYGVTQSQTRLKWLSSSSRSPSWGTYPHLCHKPGFTGKETEANEWLIPSWETRWVLNSKSSCRDCSYNHNAVNASQPTPQTCSVNPW